MLKLKEGTPFEMLQQFAVDLDAVLQKDLGASRLVLDNEKGKGGINLYEVFPGLTAWVSNVNFSKEYKIDFNFSGESHYYFGYHIHGHQMTKFSNETEFKKIRKNQTFILSGEPETTCEFIIPANTKYECCYLIIQPALLNKQSTKTKKQLKSYLEEVLDPIDSSIPYRYFGKIDLRSGVYADIIVKNKRTDLVGRLLIEAAIMNMLASQIESHDRNLKIDTKQRGISKQDLLQITNLGDYIRKNISEKHTLKQLSRIMGLSEKKLQDGVHFLYGHSVNRYIMNIRLEHALELFNESEMNASQICYEIGYTSRSYFSKQFKDRYGVLPSEYRNSLYKEDIFFEISYRSKGSKDLTQAKIDTILKTSRSSNKTHFISGCLIYYKNVFFQLIEGPKKEVLELYENIKRDKRHFDVQLIWQQAKSERDFKEWDMAMLSDIGILKIPHEGNTKNLNINHLMGEVNEQSLESKHLWRQVSNFLKA